MLIPGQPPPRPDAIAVQPGDRVRVTLQSGKTTAMTVAEVRPYVLVGKTGQLVPFDGMTRLEKRHFSTGRTLILVGALALLVMTLAAAATVAAYGDFLSPGGL